MRLTPAGMVPGVAMLYSSRSNCTLLATTFVVAPLVA